MKKSLRKIPKAKRAELKRGVEIIRGEAEVEAVILFGSYARGDFVERDVYVEGGITYEYASDLDLLVIAPDRKALNGLQFEDRLESRIADCPEIETSVTVIAHTAGFVNQMLAEGRYFFRDIVKEGILLYDAGRVKLKPSRKLTKIEYVKLVARNFRHWDKSANEAYTISQDCVDKRRFKWASFLLHQATERWYHAAHLTFTHYKIKTHDIRKLGNRAAAFALEFKRVFPRATPAQRQCFKLLRAAYIGARYDKNYRITRAQLEYLAKRVRKLRAITRRVCKGKIAALRAEAEA